MPQSEIGAGFYLILWAAIFATLFWTLHRTSRVAAGLSSILFAIALIYFSVSPALVAFVAVTSLLSAVPQKTRIRTRVALIVASFVLLGPMLVGKREEPLILTITDGERIKSLVRASKTAFPILSLDERLAYEGDGIARLTVFAGEFQAESGADVALPDEVEERLASVEIPGWTGWRRDVLSQLHNETRSRFEAAEGLGDERMPFLLDKLLPKLMQQDHVEESLTAEDDEPSYVEADGQTIRRGEGSPSPDLIAFERPSRDGLMAMHDASRRAFVARNDFGFVTDQRRAAGFLSHAFRRPQPSAYSDRQNDRWDIKRLELVSLLKHETPRVYVSKKLPNLEKLKSVPTRPLNQFEAASLPKLFREEDIVFQEEVDHVLLLGSLRASKQCLQCHAVKRGELLGAFSYELRISSDASTTNSSR